MVPSRNGKRIAFITGVNRQTVEQGAQAVVQLATVESDGLTGGYFNAAGPLPW